MHILIENDFIEGFGMDTMTRMKLKNTADVHSLDEWRLNESSSPSETPLEWMA